MKCLVCGKNYEAAECPRCRFPDIQLMGDRDEALAQLMPTIRAYRANFLKGVTVELVAYRWKDLDGRVALDREDRITLGTADALQQGETWLEEKFARIPDQKEITVKVCITAGGEKRDVSIAVPNLHKPELQQLGVSVDGDCNLRLLLRNETEAPTTSAGVPLFIG